MTRENIKKTAAQAFLLVVLSVALLLLGRGCPVIRRTTGSSSPMTEGL